MHLIAAAAAAGSLLVGFITKLTPFSWTDCYSQHDFQAPPYFHSIYDNFKSKQNTLQKESAMQSLLD